MSKTRVLWMVLVTLAVSFCHAAPGVVPMDGEDSKVDKHGNTPLHVAVKKRSTTIEEIETLLESGVSIDAKDSDGKTPLYVAVEARNAGAVEYLIFRGADVNARNKYGRTPLYKATPEIGRMLVAAGADVNAVSNDGRTPLFQACRPESANADYVRLLIARGTDIHAVDTDGCNALLWALRTYDEVIRYENFRKPDMRAQMPPACEEIVGLLIRLGVDVNARWGDVNSHMPHRMSWQQCIRLRGCSAREYGFGRSAAHYIAEHMPLHFPLCVEYGANLDVIDERGRVFTHFAAKSAPDVLDYVLKHCGNPHARDCDGNTPLHVAAGHSLENVRLLVAFGADIHAKNDDGLTPLCYAADCENDGLETVRFLHERGAELNVAGADGSTNLHRWVTDTAAAECLQYLLEHGADIHARDADGETPLHYAARFCNDTDVPELLLEHGADIHARDNDGQTALHVAVQSMEYQWVMQFLLEKDADIHAKDKYGRTVLHFAASRGQWALMLFQDAGLDFTARDDFGKTLLHHAAQRQFREKRQNRWYFIGENPTFQYLLDCGLDINAQDNDGNTPLHDAAWRGDDVKTLLILGADPNIRNKAGELPRDMTDDEQIQQILREAAEGGINEEWKMDNNEHWRMNNKMIDSGGRSRAISSADAWSYTAPCHKSVVFTGGVEAVNNSPKRERGINAAWKFTIFSTVTRNPSLTLRAVVLVKTTRRWQGSV